MKAAEAKPISAQKKAYRKYLESEAWIKLRCDIITIRGDRCERCGRRGIHVHHLSYKNIGHEEPEDVILLCGTCHQKEHGLIKPKRKRAKKPKKVKMSPAEKKIMAKWYKLQRSSAGCKRICPVCDAVLENKPDAFVCSCGYSKAKPASPYVWIELQQKEMASQPGRDK